ncbi:hypothetical protein NQ318_020173 [Aromia moschata]|uniref:DUF5641 domain-containing protein n=2 Tax=Aromia moschata TaxID=1265417 RepID=A0AAV8ZBC1_9CUCU|nr:hypothetical protein NQ318_020173 [Aromia moschata]
MTNGDMTHESEELAYCRFVFCQFSLLNPDLGENMAQNKHIREQRALRESLYLRLEDIATVAASFQTEPENHTVRRMLEVRSESVKNIYDDILKIHGDIVMKVATLPDSNLDEEHAFLKRVDETYFTIQSIVRELPVQFRSSAQSPVADKTSIVQTSKTRLPKLNLQTFDGKLENWSAFIQVFNRSIHDNNTLANVERFEYLLGCLSGEPLNLIKTIVLSDDNYPIAYKTLLDRYDNKRELATHYWDRLRSLQKLKDETPSGLRSLIYNFNENLSALRALKIADSLEDFMLLNILLEKLDSKTRRYFEAEIRNLKGEIPAFDTLNTFVESQCHVLAAEHSTSLKSNTYTSKNNNTFTSRPKLVSSLVANTSEQKCLVCEKDHIIYRCPVLKAKSPADRFKVVKEKRLCINCLRPHQVKNCSSTSTCRTCHKNHHTLLHFDRFSGSSGAINETSDSGNTAPAEIVVPTVNALASSLSRQVALLSTALVDVHDSQGHPHTLRVLIDNGSEASFITVKAARNLNLKRQHDKIQIQGIGANSSIFSSGSIHCKISPHGSCQPAIHLEAHIIPHVASVIPSQSLQFYSWDHINNLKLADPNFYISRHVDLLLGADVYAQLIRPGLVLAPSPRCPSAFNTIFGWVLSGSVQPEQTNERVINSFHVKIMEDCPENDLESTMRQFWQVEEVPMISTSPDDELCEKLYVEGYSKLPSGRFVVPLPFRDSKPVFPESKDIAIRRFFALEHRLKKDPVLKQSYVDFMHDSSPPLHWRVGRVLETHPGSDNVVRVVTLKTALGTLKRPVVKLCPLPYSL